MFLDLDPSPPRVPVLAAAAVQAEGGGRGITVCHQSWRRRTTGWGQRTTDWRRRTTGWGQRATGWRRRSTGWGQWRGVIGG